jgi:hypothetical protein
MRATGFEFRHQTLLHLFVIGMALLTYAVNPDDIVWALVRGHSNNRLLERVVFGAGAIVAVGSAALEMWVTVRRRAAEAGKFRSEFQRTAGYVNNTLWLARLLFALGLGLLLPLPGTVVLVAGETILVLRLLLRDRETTPRPESTQTRHTAPEAAARVTSVEPKAESSWRTGFRVSASKWGVAASLVLLSVTLQDRIAEISAGIGFLAWLIMNAHRSFASGTRT